jgi:hypothetical protein
MEKLMSNMIGFKRMNADLKHQLRMSIGKALSDRGKMLVYCLVIPRNGSYSEYRTARPYDLLEDKEKRTRRLQSVSRGIVRKNHVYALVCPSCLENIVVVRVDRTGNVEFAHEFEFRSVSTSELMQRVNSCDSLFGRLDDGESECIHRNSRTSNMPLKDMIAWRPVWKRG